MLRLSRSTNAVLICQPHAASTCWTASSVPNTTRCFTSTRRRRLVDVKHRVVFGTLEAVQQVLAACGWQINTAFVERLNLSIRQHVAAVGRRVSTLCKGEAGLRQPVALYQVD